MSSLFIKICKTAVAVVLVYTGYMVITRIPKEPQPCIISGEQMVHLRDSFLMDEIEKGAHNSFREPFVDSILDAEAARRADSMYLRRLSQYD